MIRFFIILSSVFWLHSCIKVPKGTPKCIKEQIKTHKNNNPCENVTVDEYMFQGKRTYVIDVCPEAIDAGYDVFDEDCNYMGLVVIYISMV